MWGVLDTTLCDKVCWWLARGQWFSPGTPVSSTNKTDRNNITEIFNLNVFYSEKYWKGLDSRSIAESIAESGVKHNNPNPI
jgi:hypothetical protein